MYTLGAAFLGLGAGFGGAGFCGDKKKKNIDFLNPHHGLSTLE